MSYVTNLLLSFYVLEREEERMAEVNAFFDPERHGRGLASLQDSGDWYGGTKGFEQPLYVGAFNHLDEEGFLAHLRERVRWEHPEYVQVIRCGEHDDLFTIYTITDTPPPEERGA